MDIGNLNNMTNVALCNGFNMTFKLATVAVYMLMFFFIIFLCNFLHLLLRPLSQPRVVSECIVGLLIGNLLLHEHSISPTGIQSTLQYIVDGAMVLHMFVVGLEVDPYIFLEINLPETQVAYSGLFTTFFLAAFLSPLLNIPDGSNVPFNLCHSIVVAGTGSPLLTRIITDLKIGKSDIGRFVVSVGVHTDILSTVLISIGCIVFDPYTRFMHRNLRDILKITTLLFLELVLAAKLTPKIMNWVNRENPDGKPMKGSHLVLAVAYMFVICSFSPLFAGYNKVMSAFLAGLFMPKEGRIAKMIISKVNYFFAAVFFPLFFFWMGSIAQLDLFDGRQLSTWENMIFIFLFATVGKGVGSMMSGVILGFQWKDSVAAGLLLSIKGHFHVYLAIMASNMGLTTLSTSISMLLLIFLTIIYTPLIVANIISRARKRAPTQKMALQWLNHSSELRILLCLHGPENVSSAINFMEISRGPPDPGILVYLTDMVEMTDKVAATMSHGQGANNISVTDPEVVEMREKIGEGVNKYIEENKDGVTAKRLLALSTLNSMHQDVCVLAEDLMISFIILPFHKQKDENGRLGTGHTGFRHVNRKIFRYAPCSVGILVDRGLGATMMSRSAVSIHAAVIFIGGKDDREALAYAGRVACHPGLKLTVIRFLLEASGDSVSSIITIAKTNTSEHQEEMKADDECFADFYDKHVAGGPVAYMEKYLVNSGQTFSTLRSLEGQYGLFIVGRGGRVNSILTVGMNDWEECPELGPIGDILSAPDFSLTASVLIIQQHSLRGDLEGLQEEFSIM